MDNLIDAILLESSYQELISGNELGPFTSQMSRASFLGFLQVVG